MQLLESVLFKYTSKDNVAKILRILKTNVKVVET